MTEVKDNIVDHENNDQANSPLNPPRPNIVRLVIVNNTGNQMIRGNVNTSSGSVDCSTGNGYIGPEQVVVYTFRNTYTETINSTFTYEIFSVAGAVTVTVSGTLGQTPENGYITAEGPGWGADVSVAFLSNKKNIKKYIMYIDNIEQ